MDERVYSDVRIVRSDGALVYSAGCRIEDGVLMPDLLCALIPGEYRIYIGPPKPLAGAEVTP